MCDHGNDDVVVYKLEHTGALGTHVRNVRGYGSVCMDFFFIFSATELAVIFINDEFPHDKYI